MARWWAAPITLLAAGLAVVTWAALRDFAAGPGFLGALRLVIEAIATGFLAMAAWRVARGG